MSACPGTELAIARVRQATEELGIATNLRLVTVDTEQRAALLGFEGSPTVRIDGIDVEAEPGPRPFGLTCRLYRDENGAVERAPSVASIRAALVRTAALHD